MAKKVEKNAQIIAAATEEFLSKGLDAASMHNIAEQAEVSKRTLYKYYPTKDDLFSALIDEILDRVEDMYHFEYSKEASIKEQIENVVTSKMELTLADSFVRISKIVMGELLKGRRPSAEQLERMYKSESLFVEWIKKAQNDGKIKKEVEAEDMATQLHSLLKGQIYWPVLMGFECKKNIDLNKVKNQTVDFFVNSFCLN